VVSCVAARAGDRSRERNFSFKIARWRAAENWQPLRRYYGLASGITYGVGGLGLLAGADRPAFALSTSKPLYYVAACGPTTAELIMVGRRQGRSRTFQIKLYYEIMYIYMISGRCPRRISVLGRRGGHISGSVATVVERSPFA
jgi:hypothetical protein